MKSLWENENFCAESFGDDLPNELKETTVAAMLRAARQSRRNRIVRGGLVVAGLIVIGMLLLMPAKPPIAKTQISASRSENFQIVRTEAFKAEIIVRTVRKENLTVGTKIQGTYDVLTDEQILEIFRDRGVALVKMGDRTELQFLNENSDDVGL